MLLSCKEYAHEEIRNYLNTLASEKEYKDINDIVENYVIVFKAKIQYAIVDYFTEKKSEKSNYKSAKRFK